jgi:HAD superfamily hydrolase (TIGR01509 family)
MDGTLVDTEPYWMEAESDLVASYGGNWTHGEAMQLVGKGLLDSAGILQNAGVEMEAEAIVQHLTDRVAEMLRTQGVPFRPGARELLADLRAAGIPTALVTMSLRRMADRVVGLMDFEAFDLVVAGDEHPAPYLRAAELLEIDIAQAVIIEDSTTGVASGVASGALTLGVPHLVPLDGHGAHTLWPTLEGRTAADIVALHAASIEEGTR